MSRRNITHWTCPRQGCSNTIVTRINLPAPPTCDSDKHTAVPMTPDPKDQA